MSKSYSPPRCWKISRKSDFSYDKEWCKKARKLMGELCKPQNCFLVNLHAVLFFLPRTHFRLLFEGHADARWVKAIQEQAETLAHASNLFHTVPQVSCLLPSSSHESLRNLRIAIPNSHHLLKACPGPFLKPSLKPNRLSISLSKETDCLITTVQSFVE